jgi:4-amino-4-deoxy-L-arabinose transferase-like glycosyltransferase
MDLRGTARIDRRPAFRTAGSYEQARRLARVAAAPVLVVCLAAFLRLYRLELQAWTPDTYEQMFAASRLIGGEFPLSRLYPPGIAVTLAPAYLIFPDTLATMQGVIIAMSLALVVLTYAWSQRLVDDGRAALLAAFSVATLPQFVYFSRDGLFDVVGTTYLLASVFTARLVRDRGVAWGAAYGVLVAITLNVRATNPAIVPAILIYALAPDVRATLRRSLPTMTSAAVVAGTLTCAGILAGGWWGTTSNGATTFADYVPNIGFYLRTIAGDIYAPFIVPLALVGAHRLWKQNPPFMLMAGYVLVAWPLVHAPFLFANTRYMLPVVLLMLMLAAHGASVLVTAPRTSKLAVFKPTAAGLVALYVAVLLIGGGAIVNNWSNMSGSSNEVAFKELRPQIAELPSGSLVVGAVLRGLRESNHGVEYFDLIDHARTGGITPERVDDATARIDAALDADRNAYYVYSAFEAERDSLGKDDAGFDLYFNAIADTFEVTLLYQASLEDYRIYQIAPR